MKRILTALLLMLMALSQSAQEITAPAQAVTGPGGQEYLTDSVEWFDYAETADGYWLFRPDTVLEKPLGIVVFLHGYGAYNPMIYGQWIRHIARKGNVVLYPRYQKTITNPSPNKFGGNASKAIIDGLARIDTTWNIDVDTNHLQLVGHSYGGVIAADLAMNFDQYKIPKPTAMMLVSPGTGPFKGGLHESYEELDPGLKMLIIVSNNDRTVGDKIGKRIFETSEQVTDRILIRQYEDKKGVPPLTAGHNESYSLDLAFDSGVRNYTAKRALRIARVDVMDYNGYWKLFDALRNCDRIGKDCELAFPFDKNEIDLGLWSDSTTIRPLFITVPEKLQANQKK